MFLFVVLFLGLILIGSNVYLAWRLGSLLRGLFGYRKHYNLIVYGAVFVLTVFLILSLTTKVGFFVAVGSVYMGIWVNLLLCFLLCEAVFAITRLFLSEANRNKAKPIQRILCLALPILLSFYGFLNAAIVTTTEYEITLDKKGSDLKIVMISDLHLGALGSEAKLDGWVDAINEEKPDLVLIAGDIVDSDYHKIKDPERAAAILASIRSTYGVYGCLGNHDAGKTYSDMIAFFDRANITILRDEYEIVPDKAILIGRRDSSPIGFSDVEKGRRAIGEIVDTLPTTDLPIIVMDHNPASIGEYDARVDLVVSGHTHKGQVFPAGLLTNLLYTEDYGRYQANPSAPVLIVTSGIGGWGMPMRTSGHSEICVITVSEQ